VAEETVVAEPVRVFLVNSCAFVADALGRALSGRGEVAVVGSGNAPEEVDAALEAAPVEVVLVQAGPDAPAVIRHLRALHPALGILVVGLPDDADAVVRLIEAGASGYLSRDAPLADLVDAVGATHRGEATCSPRGAAAVFNRVWQLGPARGRPPALREPPPLSAREQEVLGLLGGGLANKEIARALGIRVCTVKNHVHNILEKLHVRHRRAAARYAAAAGAPAGPARACLPT
jgi:DNA-binding NarL/FixJ family response regulator